MVTRTGPGRDSSSAGIVRLTGASRQVASVVVPVIPTHDTGRGFAAALVPRPNDLVVDV